MAARRSARTRRRFAGTLLELLLAADRACMRDDEAESPRPALTASRMNFGPPPTVAAVSRLESRQLLSDQLAGVAPGGRIYGTGAPSKFDWNRV